MFFAIVVGLDELPDALVAMGIGVEDGRHNTGRRHLCVCTLHPFVLKFLQISLILDVAAVILSTIRRFL